MHAEEINRLLERYWGDNVYNKCVYRGMDENDLVFPLDPNHSPFKHMNQLLLDFFAMLDKLIASKIMFDIVETHFGTTYKHSLTDIIKWSKRDLATCGIDFTSSYQTAREYADCWHGSQLKQNIKTISENLIANSVRLGLPAILTSIELKNIYAIERWVNTPRETRPVILHVRRSFYGFRETEELLPIGTKESFLAKALLNLQPLETIKTPTEFCCSLVKPISISDVLLIERT